MPGDSRGHLEVRYQQTAAVRTNCMDCLDRTNVVQSMLARFTLTRQLVDAGVLRAGETQDSDPVFASLFRNVWADNADVVSKSYSGTGALKTDFTRTGSRTRAGALQDLNNSITRYVKNNFLDGPRQDGFDLFTGAYEPSQNIGGANILRRSTAYLHPGNSLHPRGKLASHLCRVSYEDVHCHSQALHRLLVHCRCLVHAIHFLQWGSLCKSDRSVLLVLTDSHARSTGQNSTHQGTLLRATKIR